MSRSRSRLGLSAALAIIFFVFSTVVLLISSGLQITSSYQIMQENISNKQQLIAQEAAQTVSNFIQEKFGILEMNAKFSNSASTEERQKHLDILLGTQQAFRQVLLLDKDRQVSAYSSRIAKTEENQIPEYLIDIVIANTSEGKDYISPIYIDPKTSEPITVMAVPMIDVHESFRGTLIAEVNLKFMWELAHQLKVGETGYAYVVDEEGNLIAFSDTARVLRRENISEISPVEKFINSPSATGPQEVETFTGINGNKVVGTYVPLGTPSWAVITELPWGEAYQAIVKNIFQAIGVVSVMAFLAGLAGVVVANRLSIPLINLMTTAERITNGEMELQANTSGLREISRLGIAFNSMTTQLRQIFNDLEQRVAERTAELSQASENLHHRVNQLQASSDISRVATTLTDPHELLYQVVELIQERFDFYYASVFLIEDKRFAVLQYGTGEPGRVMREKGHRLEIGGESMIGWVCAHKKARIALDVGQEAVRFANPLLPETHSEIALPLMVGEHIIGALGIQSSKTGAFDENDILILQGMTDQIAVALSNAQLFEEIQQRAAELAIAKEEADKARQASEDANRTLASQIWQTNGQTLLNEKMRGEQDIVTLASNVIQQLCTYLDAQVGMLYIQNEETLTLVGSYAYAKTKNSDLPEQFKLGEGLIGQTALEKKASIITIPDDHIAITSGLGKLMPKNILVTPFIYNNQVIGVIEMGTLSEFTPTHLEFLEKSLESVAIAFMTAQARTQVNTLLHQTQKQAAELKLQEEELRSTNEELEAQAENLLSSEKSLREKQTELENANTELEEKAQALQEQQHVLDRQNQELEQKAEELALASKYKSEFLANVSHELRTPLNSMLILSSMLSKNEDDNLTDEQVESIQVIHSGGIDLLNLINEVLDLAKIEAGRMEFYFAPMEWEQLVDRLRGQFTPPAQEKGLELNITLDNNVPESIVTDHQRLEQIIKNLLSNAFKFTEQGQISLHIHKPKPEEMLSFSRFAPDQTVAISVSDTGIGMTHQQQKIVFEAFQQADGSTSRQYGGTGLGLTITRELTNRLGGHIDLKSEVGKGSTFTIYLPIDQAPNSITSQATPTTRHKESQKESDATPIPSFHPSHELHDDSNNLQPDDRVLLIVEDNRHISDIIYKHSHKKGFKCLLATNGKTALKTIKTYKPHAIILDLKLPRMSGWEVLSTSKDDPDTRHIPVYILSTSEDEDLIAIQRGAMGSIRKPINQKKLDQILQRIDDFISREIRALLIIINNDELRTSIKELLEGPDITISEAMDGKTTIELLSTQHFDCMIVDKSLPDISSSELLNQINNDKKLTKCPVVIYSSEELTEEENHELMKYANSVIIKSIKSPKRLLDETALFLHRVVSDMSAEKQHTIRQLHDPEKVFANKQVLIVDDDARNAFALSRLLTERGIKAHIAPNALKGIEILEKIPEISLILMDIMMPGMDGYEAIQHIRQLPQFQKIPILTLTAKAMKSDREKCIEVGANDYIAKPIDPARLFSMLRVWLSKE